MGLGFRVLGFRVVGYGSGLQGVESFEGLPVPLEFKSSRKGLTLRGRVGLGSKGFHKKVLLLL